MRAIRWSVAFVLLLAVSRIPARPQDRASAAEDNLYSQALFASLPEMEKSWGQIDDSYQGVVRTDYRHMRVEKAPGITDGLPNKVGDFSVEFLDRQEEVARYKRQRKGFSILGISPMQNHGAELEITISVYYVRFAKGRLLSGLSDWSTVTFHYDPEAQKFVIASVKLGGI